MDLVSHSGGGGAQDADASLDQISGNIGPLQAEVVQHQVQIQPGPLLGFVFGGSLTGVDPCHGLIGSVLDLQASKTTALDQRDQFRRTDQITE